MICPKITAATRASLRNSTVKIGNRTLGRLGFPRVGENRPRQSGFGNCLHLHSNPKLTKKGDGMRQKSHCEVSNQSNWGTVKATLHFPQDTLNP